MADVKRLQIRRDTLADWVAVNPILLEGEVGLIIENGRISSLKIGDGVSSFAQLPQLTLLEAVFGGYVSRQDLSASLRDYATMQYVDSEIGKILGGASGAYDTLKEIEDILKNDTTGLAALLEEIGTKADTSVVDALASRVSQNESNIADHTNKITANTNNIDNTIRRVAANEADLEQLNQTVDKIYGEYVTISDIPTKTSQLFDDIGYALARNIKALAGLDIVTKDYIADAAVTTSKIKDGAITPDKLSSAIQQQLSWIPSTTDDLPEGSSNLYFTNDRAVSAVSPRLIKVENGLIATQEEVRGYSAIISELQGTVKLKADQSSVDSLAEAIEAINEGISDLTTDDVYEGGNKYFTNARAIAALSDTLKGYVTTLAFQDYAKQIQQNSTNITKLNETVDKIYEEYVTWDNIPTKTSQLTNDSGFITSQSLDGLLEDYAKKSGYSALKVLATDSSGNIVAHYVSTDKLGFLSNVTSDIQAQINALSIPDLDGYVTTETLTSSLNNLANTYLSFRGGGTVSGATTFSGGLSVQNSLTLLGVNVAAGSSGLTFDGKIPMYSGDAYTKSEADKEFHPLTTVDAAPTINSRNLVTSGGVAKAVADLAESADGLYQRKGSYLTASSSLSSAKLDKNTITIVSTPVALGESITKNQLITNLGLKGLAFKDSIDLSGYLPLSGGTISGNLQIGSNDNTAYKYLMLVRSGHGVQINNIGTAAYFTFGAVDNTGNMTSEKVLRMGDMGLKYSPDNSTWYDIIHSGNIADYVLFKSEIEELTESDNLNEYTSGYFGWQNAHIPLNGKGSNTAMLAFKNMRGTESFQLVFDANNNNIWYRNQNTSQVWRDWKTIAFTDSTVASATRARYIETQMPYSDDWYTDRYRAYTRWGSDNANILDWRTEGDYPVRVDIAKKLNTARSIWGQSFDGSGDVDGDLHLNASDIYWHSDKKNYCIESIGRENASPYLRVAFYGGISFHTTGTERMYINNSGNVGIGTTNPNTKLHVVGGTKVEGNLTVGDATLSGSSGDLEITPSGNVIINGSDLEVGGSGSFTSLTVNTNTYLKGGSTNPYLRLLHNSTNFYVQAYNGSLMLGAGADNSMWIAANGNVEVQKAFDVNHADGYVRIVDGSIFAKYGTSTSWEIMDDGSAYFAEVNTPSDSTKKNILSNIELTTSHIANAPAVSFTWKASGRKSCGTIAQYWKEVLPEVVSGEEGSYGMNYAVLGVVSSIILARNIETHEQRIARLEKEISDLQKELNALVNNE